MRIRTIFAVASLGLAVVAVSARAQTGSQSDVTGVSTTGSTIAGGAFTPTEAGTVSVPATAATAAAVVTATATVTTTLSTGSLTTVTGNPIAPATQALLAAVMQSSSPTTGPAGTLATNLTASGVSAPLAAALTESMVGLGSNPSPGQMAAAIENYNAVIANAPASFFANIPQSILAIQSILSAIGGST